MSTRKSNRNKQPPKRFGYEIFENDENENLRQDNTSENLRQDNTSNSTTTKSFTSSCLARKQLEADIEKEKELQILQREHDEKDLDRQRRMEELEMRKKELERQRQKDEKELERRKRLLEMENSLKSLSVKGSQYCPSEVSIVDNQVGLKEIASNSKVEVWLEENERSVQTSPIAVMTTAAKMLADSVKKAVQPTFTSCRQQLPTFSGRPDEWPMFFSAFESTVKLYNDDDNLARLRNCLEGDAFKMVRPLFVSSKNVNAIIKTLKTRFGRPEFILESMMNQTKMLSPVQEDNIVGLIEFSTTILNFTSIAQSLQMETYLTNPTLLNELLGKLPYQLKYNWAQHLGSISLSQPTIHDFSNWLETQCTLMSIYFRPNCENPVKKRNEFKPVLTNSPKELSLRPTCVFCPDKHESKSCKVFRKADVPQRWKMVSGKKLCFYCFERHQLKYCKTKQACGIHGCKLYHHRLLHNEKLEKNPVQTNQMEKQPNNEVISNHIEGNISNRVLLRICPVTLYGPKSKLDTYALLDDGSTVSLLDSSICNELGLEGDILPLTTCWSNSTKHHEPCSRRVELKIKGFYEDEIFTLKDVRTQSTLDLPHQMIDSVKIRKNWPHLNSITQPLPSANIKPTILIGQDNCNLILTREIIEGPTNAPVLSWCQLGWSLHGKYTQFKSRIDENFTLLSFEREDSLNEMVKKSFEIEKYGEIQPDKLKLSVEEERAVSILEKTTKKIGDRYEVGLLWKSDNQKFPPSYSTALKRLNTLEKKMEKDSNFQQVYRNKIKEYEKKGYVRKLNAKEANIMKDHTYYLPHFGVTNPNKPNKLRLVFDAAAKSHGISLNDALLSGPDYLNPLPAVLLKFRLKKYAIVGDIKEMFHQVQIREEDIDSQRFLWRTDRNKPPDTYVMKAMTFGSTCSPSSALFVVNKNARDFLPKYPDASNSILSKEYMDDLLDSTDTEEEAKRRVKEITEIHKAGGFHICNWISNSKEVLSEIPSSLKTNQTKQLKSETTLPTERVLGLWWDAESDTFVFHQNVKKLELSEIEYPTKREVLRAAMTIFDPLGLVSPTTVKGRLLVQDIWRTSLTWDQVLPPNLCHKWKEWLDEVKSLRTLRIQRFYFSLYTSNLIELHIFVDASEEAFAAVAYLRQKSNEKYETMLVMSRAKVAPLKSITIPRLELQAAILGCRLASTVEKDVGVSINKRTFWSDSQTVLHWIKSDPKNYKQFVSNRIGEIQNFTETDEWKWVPSKENPADYATRSTRRFKTDIQNMWMYGPSFLSHDCKDWPNQPMSLLVKDTQENKKEFIGVISDANMKLIDLKRYSSWEKPKRIAAWIFRYIKKLKLQCKPEEKTNLQLKNTDYTRISELQPEELKRAEDFLLTMSQEETFGEEKHLLSIKSTLPRSSRIYMLLPFLDSNGIMRISPRTKNSPELNEDQKCPIILDSRSYTAKLIVKKYHANCFHQGLETTIYKIREKFWILNLRPLVKKVKKECMRCRIDNAKPVPPQMAPLPEFRVSRVSHTFFYTGVDFFGPVEVTVGRRHEKRWGVLFTCLSTRAVHLEVAHSLDTNSCIMAIQRFISRRPCPSEMFSDNGTNFVACEKELRSALMTLNHAQIQKAISTEGIKWNFIPPRAPHMGGCWERLIRSVKTALRCAMRSQYPKDEELRTFLTRVEYIINCRPLTHVSVDPSDHEPLTPNHFLMESFKVTLNEDKLFKKQLIKIRTFLDTFWKRWIREYLPCLTRRCKWHKLSTPPKIGDLAIIVDEDNPRNSWPLGQITAVYPGRDNQIRVVDVTTTAGTFRRPLTKVAVLPEEGKDVNT